MRVDRTSLVPKRQRRPAGGAARIAVIHIVFGVCLQICQPASAGAQGRLSEQVVGDLSSHTVAAGETLSSIGARYGVNWQFLAAYNSLDDPNVVVPGQIIEVDNHHIVPLPPFETGVLINVPQRMLFYFVDGELFGAWPVAVGRTDWPTPTGSFEVRIREEDPTWNVPVSIQDEMRRLGQPVVTEIPPCPENPLGAFWLGLGDQGIGIHGTNRPASIFSFQTHGCIRLHPDDIETLFPATPVGTPVRIIYQPVLVARLSDGRLYLEAHEDIYGRDSDPGNGVPRPVDLTGIEDLQNIDREIIERILEEQAGIARRLD